MAAADFIERHAGGFTVRTGSHSLDATAVAPGILRILADTAVTLPETASWAVLPQHWGASEAAQHDDGLDVVGFSTGALSVAVDAGTGCMTVSTVDGTPICRDEAADALRFDAAGQFRARLRVFDDEQFFGLGDKPGPLAKRGRAYQMWNTDAYGFGEAADPLYKTIPFILSVRPGGAAYGLFLDCTHRSAIDLCLTEPDTLALAGPGPFRLYVLAGPHARDVLARFADLVGRTALPPIWALGYGQSRYSYETATEARAIAARHREAGIPLDALWLDIGFQDRNRPFTADPERYPDLGGLVAELRADGIHTVVITDAHIPVSPDEPYAPYEEGVAGNHFVRTAEGAPYVGEVWPGDCHFPDFTAAAARAWWGTLYSRFLLDHGIAGFWNDMNEPAVFKTPGHTMPLDVRHRIDEPGFSPREASHAEIHNVWGMQNARATHDGLLQLAPDRRPYVLTRASYAGGHRHAATWTGDNTSTANHLRLSTPQLLGLGLSGFALCGCDIGGFRRNASPELLTRWFAVGAFNPLFRNHTDNDTTFQEAWVHGPAHEALRRDAVRARYALLPYLYTAVEECTRDGLPLMRPLFLEFEGEARFLIEEACFMVGDALLVAPPPDDSIGPHPFRLPEGALWYDHWTGEPVRETTVECARPAGAVAVFVRGGSIVPMVEPPEHTGALHAAPLVLHVYPDENGEASGTLYADDGHSLAHARGVFFRQRLRFSEETLYEDVPEGTFAFPYAGRTTVVHERSGALPLNPAQGGSPENPFA